MRLRRFILASLAALVAFVSCEDLENLGLPTIKLDGDGTMAFEIAGGDQQITLTATRDWWVEYDADWLEVLPESGKASADAQTITVTAKTNPGMDRTADVKFSIGMSFQTLTVTQAGPGGSADALIVYANDFDKEEAIKGSSGWDTYLDTFTGWKNEFGSGIASVTYAFDRITARTNSGNGSAGSYSDYAGSGSNYLWFGSGAPYFAVKNITLPSGKTDYTLSFGSERYEFGKDENVFDFNEFKVYISADGAKWVKLACEWAAGVTPDGRWDLASSTFSLPAGTETLNVYFAATVGSAYALDDLKLVESAVAGTAIDFTAGENFEVGDNTSGGDKPGAGDVPEGTGDGTEASPYSAAKAWHIASALGAEDKNTGVYVEGIIKEIKEVNTQYGNATYWITDEDGIAKFYVYRGNYLDNAKFTSASQIKVGDKVVIYGDLMNYMGDSPQLGQGNYIVEFNGESGEGGTDEVVKSDIAGIIAVKDNTSVETEGVVVAKYMRGVLLKDDTGYLLVYDGEKAPAQIGDKVNVKGTKTTYANLAQIGTPAVTVLSSNNTVTHPDATVLDGAGMDNQLKDTAVEYVEYTGTLNISGYYYNVNVAGASTAIGSLSYPDAEAYGLAALNGKEIKVTGYYIGVSGGKYVNTMITAVAATGNDSGSGDSGNEGGEGENPGDEQSSVWSYTFVKDDLGKDGSPVESVTLNGISWDFSMVGSTYLGFESSNNARGLQMGKSKQPASSITLSTEGFTGTVKKIVVNTSGASNTDATLVVKVGDVEFGTSVNMTTASTEYTFEGSESGKIELKWTLTTAAVYIKSISVYTE